MFTNPLWQTINTFPTLLPFANSVFWEHTLYLLTYAFVLCFFHLVVTHLNHTQQVQLEGSFSVNDVVIRPVSSGLLVSTPPLALPVPSTAHHWTFCLRQVQNSLWSRFSSSILFPVLARRADGFRFTPQSIIVITRLSADIPSSIWYFISSSSTHLVPLKNPTAQDRAQQVTTCGPPVACHLVL